MTAIERRVWLAFSLVAVLAVAIGWLTYASSRRLLDDQDALAQSHETITALERTLSSLQGVETAAHGYVLTGNRDFLDPYTPGLEQLAKDLARLKRLTEGDTAATKQLATLELLAAEKVDIARTQVEIRDAQSQAAAEHFVSSGRGEAVMRDVRAAAAAMVAAEEARLRSLTAASDATTRNTLILTGALAALSLGLFAILVAAIMRVLRVQRRAADANARLSTIVNASDDAIMSLDLERRIASWNPGAEKLLGYTAPEAIGQPVSFIAPPDQLQAQSQTVQKLLEGSGAEVQDTVRLAKGGRLVDVSLSAFPLRDSTGVLTGFGAILHDITARKQAEAALRESQQRFAAVFDVSPVGISITRASDGLVIDVNRCLLDMLGFEREDVIGHTPVELGTWVDPSLRPALLQRFREQGSLPDTEVQMRTNSGRLIDTILAWETLDLGGETCLVALIHDITARKQAEEALREAEQRWETVFTTSAVGITVSNADDSVITAANQRFLDLLELSRDEVIGRSAGSLDSWLDAGEQAAVLEHLHLGDGREVEVSLRSRSGRIIHGIVSTVTVLINGRLSRVSTITDVTARVDAERERQRLFDLSPDMIVIAGFDGRFRAVNPATVETLGYSYEEILATPFVELMHEDDLDAGANALAQLVTAGGPVAFNARFRASDGRYLRVEVSASAEPGGQTFYGSARDVTARWEMAEALREGEERFRSVIQTASDAIIITDGLGTIELLNPAAEQMFGYTAAEATGQDITVLILSPEVEGPGGPIVAFLNRGDSEVPGLRREMVGRRKDGSVFLHELAANSMQLGSELKFTAIVRDITARKQLEDDLLQAREAAEGANRAKSAFLSRMSHELRTPLNVVLGFGQVLQLDPLEPQHAEAVDYILKAGRHLLELIDEVLDIARIESGRVSFSIEPVHAAGLLADAITLMRPLATQRGITIRAELEGCDCFVIADRQRLRQVFLNLLANAIKYNREGGAVDIACVKVADSAVRISVTDTGRGIAPENIGRLFVAFDRLGAEVTDVEGTGLGLALSRHLVEAMGGVIGAESTVDIGSTFWIELSLTEEPVHPPEGVATEAFGSHPWQGGQRTVLYIEDNLANLSLMERLLVGRLGLRLLAAMQGSLGLDLASEHHPDLILLDLHLPDMPGHEVLRRLQNNPDTRDIPVVIVSADATSGQVARLRAAGARAYITKPFDLKELFDAIDSILPDAN